MVCVPGIPQMTFLAVSAEVPAGRAVTSSQRIPVKLTIDAPEDVEQLAKGVFSCRYGKIKRLTQEAYAQGALLTHEDLARLLCTSLSTIKRDIQLLGKQDELIPTRGQMHDIGPGVTHKAETVRRFLRGEPPDCIARPIHHSQAAVDRYLSAYQRIRLLAQRFPKDQLPALSGVVPSVVAEYLALIQEYEPQLKLYATVTEGNQSTTTRASVTDKPRSPSAPLEAAAAGSSRSDGGGAR